MSLEIVPELSWNKGTAVQMIVDSIAADKVLVLYAGDSANDLSATEVVARLGGFAIGIGPEAPKGVDVNVESRQELVDLLANLSAALTSVTARDSVQHAQVAGYFQ